MENSQCRLREIFPNLRLGVFPYRNLLTYLDLNSFADLDQTNAENFNCVYPQCPICPLQRSEMNNWIYEAMPVNTNMIYIARYSILFTHVRNFTCSTIGQLDLDTRTLPHAFATNVYNAKLSHPTINFNNGRSSRDRGWTAKELQYIRGEILSEDLSERYWPQSPQTSSTDSNPLDLYDSYTVSNPHDVYQRNWTPSSFTSSNFPPIHDLDSIAWRVISTPRVSKRFVNYAGGRLNFEDVSRRIQCFMPDIERRRREEEERSRRWICATEQSWTNWTRKEIPDLDSWNEY